jgi:isopentenyl-diphosphate delta-isomerase
VDQVVLVDTDAVPIGTAEKLEAHRSPGMLHLAISVFLFDDQGRLLLQRRSPDKYHFRGLWSNSCCSHPRPGEAALPAGRRRLREEMGIEAELRAVGKFRYRAEDPDTGMVETEIDHVLIGRYEGDPEPDLAEVSQWRWVDLDDLAVDLARLPGAYTPWLPQALAVATGIEVTPLL